MISPAFIHITRLQTRRIASMFRTRKFSFHCLARSKYFESALNGEKAVAPASCFQGSVSGPLGTGSMPRWRSYHSASAFVSLERKKNPPMPVTFSMTPILSDLEPASHHPISSATPTSWRRTATGSRSFP